MDSQVSSRPLEIFVIPYLTPGHLIPLSELACLFAVRGEHVTIITTTTKAAVIQKTINKFSSSGHPVSLHPIPFPSKEAGLPEGLELEQANDVETAGKFILGLNLMQPIIEDFVVMRRPDCIIADKFYPWTSDLAARLSIPRLVFDPYSIFAKSLHEALLNPNSPHLTVESDYDPFVIPDFPHRITMTRSQLPDSRFAQLFKVFREAEVNSYGLLANSVSELDSVYTEYYSKKMGHKVFHIGPASLIHQSANDKVERSHKSAVSERQCLSWLDSKKPDSVVYICFGSGCVLPDAQLMEIGYALELAGSDFIWVVAGKNKDDEDEEKWLPRGFNERVVKKGKGLVVKGWAPQLLILDHPSTGGFLTHCGWNSAIEAMIAGVPLISWPFICDNFFNEKFFTQVLGIGVEVGALDWKLFSEVGTKVINREKIEKAVRKLMDGAGEDEGKEMRKKTRELGEKATRAVKEAGSSHTNLTLLIEELKQLRVEREERSDQTELCRFSGAKIYPGRGIRFVRADSQVFLFANSKCKRYFHNRLKPSKLTWTAMYRKQHKKDAAAEAVKKRRRATKKPYSRSIVGATMEVIQKRRTEKPEVRDAAREAALREIKERIKKTKDEKKAKKAEVMGKSQKSSKGNMPKGAPRGAKVGGGGGKR